MLFPIFARHTICNYSWSLLYLFLQRYYASNISFCLRHNRALYREGWSRRNWIYGTLILNLKVLSTNWGFNFWNFSNKCFGSNVCMLVENNQEFRINLALCVSSCRDIITTQSRIISLLLFLSEIGIFRCRLSNIYHIDVTLTLLSAMDYHQSSDQRNLLHYKIIR